MPREKNWNLKVVSKINAVKPEQWDACANPMIKDSDCGIPYDPFVSFSFLDALESSESVTDQTGWAPYHLIIEDNDGAMLGAVPMYLKTHSRGEYVFDWSWADAFERAGGKYYPKLQISVPFTPVTGRRILTRPGHNELNIEKHLLKGCMQLAEQLNLSSLHITFALRQQWERMGRLGFLQRTDQQFHWHNNAYGHFDDFLLSLSSKKRRNIRRERRLSVENKIEIEQLTGADIKEKHWDSFFSFYMNTGGRKWGTPYLTRKFFSIISETMADKILLIMCKRNKRYMAGAINFIGSDCLFGRNWGCIEDHSFLHFEVCYYQAIEFAIKHGLSRVEAGAQGEHKLARGYLPCHTYSAHWIANDNFRDAVDNYLASERQHVDQEIDYLTAHSPFRMDNY